MAEEENNHTVTYIVKIKITLTVPIPDHDHRETQPTANAGAETASLNDDERDDVVEAAEESIPDREKQDMHVGAKTVVLLSSDDEGSVEAYDMAAKDSDENNAAQECEENVIKEKKRAGRKRKKTVYSSEEGEENELASEKNRESDHEKNWESADVEEGGFSSACVRRRERPRKIKSLKEDYFVDLEEDVKKKGRRGRKKKVIIDENDEAEQEGGNGKKVKNDENELISENNSESGVLSDDNNGYSLRDKKTKPDCIEQQQTVPKFNKRNPKVTSNDPCSFIYQFVDICLHA